MNYSKNYIEYDHISDAELETDIADTEREIKNYQDENEVLDRNPHENKTRIYMNEGRILQREALLEVLHGIRDFRKNRVHNS